MVAKLPLKEKRGVIELKKRDFEKVKDTALIPPKLSISQQF